jgi:hypothetical protein
MATRSVAPAAQVSHDAGAVSWGAVFAGAAGAAALSLVLFVLGTGLGLAVVSPWAGEGASATAIGAGTIVWVTVVQLLASVLGGYLAGRLRSRWLTIRTDEVFFRDTAHGFLAWAVSTLLMATLLSSATGAIISTAAKAGCEVASSAVKAATTGDEGESPVGYYVDALFRPAPPSGSVGARMSALSLTSAQSPVASRIPEVTRIFANALRSGELKDEDEQYLGQLVAANTGLSQADAETRVAETFAQTRQTLEQARVKAKQAADEARKASAWLALWLVVSLFIGAFVASFAAIFGGRLRDSSVLATST